VIIIEHKKYEKLRTNGIILKKHSYANVGLTIMTKIGLLITVIVYLKKLAPLLLL